jgi:hypothetical protein
MNFIPATARNDTCLSVQVKLTLLSSMKQAASICQLQIKQYIWCVRGRAFVSG